MSNKHDANPMQATCKTCRVNELGHHLGLQGRGIWYHRDDCTGRLFSLCPNCSVGVGMGKNRVSEEFRAEADMYLDMTLSYVWV